MSGGSDTLKRLVRLQRLVRRGQFLAVAALIAPMAVGLEEPQPVGSDKLADDGSSTTFTLAGGGGSYAQVTRGCDGNVQARRHDFRDFGGQIEHQSGGIPFFGVRGGYLVDQRAILDVPEPLQINPGNTTTTYINPYVGLNGGPIGVGVGVLFSNNHLYNLEDPSGQSRKTVTTGHLRLGPRKFHLSMNAFESLPLYSGGGYFNLGVGSSNPEINFWAGLSGGGVYDGGGILAKMDFPVGDHWRFGTNLRAGSTEGVTEYGVAINLSYTAFH